MPVLAIDAGTTGVTALVVGEDGDVLARGYREFAQLFADHDRLLAEQGTLDVGDLVLRAIDLLNDPAAGVRCRARFEVSWQPVVAGTLALALFALPAQRAQAATPVERAVAYLEQSRNDDGGWGAAPGQSSSQLYSGCTALGLAAAGRNPRDVGSPSAVAYIRDHANELNDLGELNREEYARYKDDVKKEGKGFFPFAMWHDTVMSLVVVSVIAALAPERPR